MRKCHRHEMLPGKRVWGAGAPQMHADPPDAAARSWWRSIWEEGMEPCGPPGARRVHLWGLVQPGSVWLRRTLLWVKVRVIEPSRDIPAVTHGPQGPGTAKRTIRVPHRKGSAACTAPAERDARFSFFCVSFFLDRSRDLGATPGMPRALDDTRAWKKGWIAAFLENSRLCIHWLGEDTPYFYSVTLVLKNA